MTTHEHTNTLAHVHDEIEVHAGHHHVNYFAVFIALCVCTALSVVFDLVHMDKTLLVALVMAVATAKALFVLTYFMHLKFEGAWKFIILAPTAILAVGLMVALAPDVGLHYYTVDVPQVRAHAEQAEHGHAHDHDKKESEGTHKAH
ncbi:MAG TPA: cytochrome C oxidase subunit IV family protein [Caulifigura sp.]|jgi:cytochrome c oxidase subunit 4|nr:cytochrome C oxidase subunit IV family protein [Caulifigura sp.]